MTFPSRSQRSHRPAKQKPSALSSPTVKRYRTFGVVLDQSKKAEAGSRHRRFLNGSRNAGDGAIGSPRALNVLILGCSSFDQNGTSPQRSKQGPSARMAAIS